jgi:ribosomal protein L22
MKAIQAKINLNILNKFAFGNSKNYKLFSSVFQTQIKDQDQSSINNKTINNADNLSNKLINFVKNENQRTITEYYTIFNKLAKKNNLSNDAIEKKGLKVKIPKIIAKPNKSKKYFQDIQNKGLFLRMKGENDYFNTSAKKVKIILAKIRGKYIYDALNILKNDHTKSSKKLQERLDKFFKQNPGNLNENKNYILRIKVATCGNRNGIQRMNYRAKGRANFWQRKQCMVNIGFDKVPIMKIAEEIASGKTPMFVRNKIKQNIFKSNSDYSEVKLLRFMTSSNGIRERRLMINSSIKRIVSLYKTTHKKKINNKLIRDSLIKSLTPSCLALLKKFYFMDPFKNKLIMNKDMEIPLHVKVKERKERFENYI